MIEQKIYDRQVTKEGLAARVVDQRQVKRLFNSGDLADLFHTSDQRGQCSEQVGGQQQGEEIGLKEHQEFVHFALTSEDVNCTACPVGRFQEATGTSVCKVCSKIHCNFHLM